MNFRFPVDISWFSKQPNKGLGISAKPSNAVLSMGTIMEQPNQGSRFDIKVCLYSLFSIIPWAINAKDKIRMPSTVNKGLKKHAQSSSIVENRNPLRFRPYVSKVPWHTGPRGFFCQLFPRYGHYCGPNWSSGKDRGSLIWDKRPIDWLDYCCYCHDIGYDTHDQANMLKADLEFLECLEKLHMKPKGDPHIANVYKTMCIAGLRNMLIPYRETILKLQSGQPLINFRWPINVRWRFQNLQQN